MKSKPGTNAAPSHPLHILFAGSAQQCTVLQKVLGTHVAHSDLNIDGAGDLQEVQARLSRKTYDLLIFARREWNWKPLASSNT